MQLWGVLNVRMWSLKWFVLLGLCPKLSKMNSFPLYKCLRLNSFMILELSQVFIQYLQSLILPSFALTLSLSHLVIHAPPHKGFKSLLFLMISSIFSMKGTCIDQSFCNYVASCYDKLLYLLSLNRVFIGLDIDFGWGLNTWVPWGKIKFMPWKVGRKFPHTECPIDWLLFVTTKQILQECKRHLHLGKLKWKLCALFYLAWILLYHDLILKKSQ